jgi:hypothetical protein
MQVSSLKGVAGWGGRKTPRNRFVLDSSTGVPLAGGTLSLDAREAFFRLKNRAANHRPPSSGKLPTCPDFAQLRARQRLRWRNACLWMPFLSRRRSSKKPRARSIGTRQRPPPKWRSHQSPHSRGSTGSLSRARTPNTHSCTRRSGSCRTKRSKASMPSANSRTASDRLPPRLRLRSRGRCSSAV